MLELYGRSADPDVITWLCWSVGIAPGALGNYEMYGDRQLFVPNKDGARFSRVVSTLKPGAGVVTPRYDVHYVVTEFGVANLYGKTFRQRAKALIDVAHPDFRAELERKAIELRYL